MAELKALMAANDLEAAEAKLQLIIVAAEEDGHIDEDEQRQIDEAKLEVNAMRRRQDEQRMAFEAAAAKAAEQAALQALLVANDVVAAQRKLAEIVAAAEADGHIDDDEKRQIDEARKELEKLQVEPNVPCTTLPPTSLHRTSPHIMCTPINLRHPYQPTPAPPGPPSRRAAPLLPRRAAPLLPRRAAPAVL